MNQVSQLDPNVLILIIGVLVFIVSILLTVVGVFIVRFLNSVDKRFEATNNSIKDTAEKIGSVLAEIRALIESTGNGLIDLRGKLEARSMDIKRNKDEIAQVMGECKRLDHKLEINTTAIASNLVAIRKLEKSK